MFALKQTCNMLIFNIILIINRCLKIMIKVKFDCCSICLWFFTLYQNIKWLNINVIHYINYFSLKIYRKYIQTASLSYIIKVLYLKNELYDTVLTQSPRKN
jgi:hypothetical protein